MKSIVITPLCSVCLILFLAGCAKEQSNPVSPDNPREAHLEIAWERLYSSMLTSAPSIADRYGALFSGWEGNWMKSTDDGRTWAIDPAGPDRGIAGGLVGVDVRKVAVSPRGSVYVLAVSRGMTSTPLTLQRSANGRNGEDMHIPVIDFAMDGSGVLYVLRNPSVPTYQTIPPNSEYVARSTDDGATWDSLRAPGKNPFRLLCSKQGVLYSSGGAQIWVYSSADSGRTWTSITFLSSRTDNVIIDANGNLFAQIVNTICRSTDNGRNWNAVFTPDAKATLCGPQWYPFVFALTPGALWRSGSGTAPWSIACGGLITSSICSLAFDSTRGLLYAGTSSSGLYVSKDEGRGWAPVKHPYPNNFGTEVQAASGGMLFGMISCSSYRDVFIRSADGGTTWQSVPTTPGTISESANRRLFIGSQNGLRYSDDGGVSWISSAFLNAAVTSTAVGKDGSVYALSANCLYRSGDNGTTWGRILEATMENAHCGVTRQGTVLVFSRGGRMWRSTSKGESWEEVQKGPSWSPEAIVISPMNVVIVHCEDGSMAASDDDGRTWEYISLPGNTSCGPPCLGTNGRLYVASGTSIYTTTSVQ